MKSFKWKILLPIILVSLLVILKYVLWDMNISAGKRSGNLTKISKKGKIIKTWEGTLDEGIGEKFMSTFSVRNSKIAEELFEYEGRKVILYYEEHFMNWPWDTKYNVVGWKAKDEEEVVHVKSDDKMIELLGKTMFCSMLGTLYNDPELYQKVKDYMKEKNLYLYNQYEKCND